MLQINISIRSDATALMTQTGSVKLRDGGSLITATRVRVQFHHGAQGMALTEILAVVFIVSVLAVIALPDMRPADTEKLGAAAAELADMVRFARDESIRTSVPHGIIADVTADRVQVFRLDLNTVPPTWLFDVYHPVAKHLYTLDINAGVTRGTTIDQAQLNFNLTCNNTSGFAFDPSGNPICTDPLTSRVDQAQTTLRLGGVTRLVVVAPITGRVTVQ